MWESVQVYVSDSVDFFDNLSAVLNEKYGSFFYTTYIDMYGYHIRFRFNGKSKLWYKWLYTLQYEMRQTIYDPDIIRYGENNQIYEYFSVTTCTFIVENKIYRSLDKRISYAIAVIDFLIEQFEIQDEDYFKKHINFWNGNISFVKINSTLAEEQILSSDQYILPREHCNDLKCLLSRINTKNSAKICFYLIHLTLNRLSFNLKDEQNIISYFDKYRR